MKASKIKEVINYFPFPSCCIRSTKSKFTIEAANLSFCQLFGFDPKNVVGRGLFESEENRLFKGREEIIEKCLHDVTKKRSAMSLAFYGFMDNTENADESNTLFMEMSPLNPECEEYSILVTLHNITTVLNLGKKASDFRKEDTHSYEDELQAHTNDLQARFDRKQVQYNAAALELDNFVYSVSHDLRAPLRRIDGFSQELINEYASTIDETGAHYLQRIRQGVQDMGHLIDDLLKLSRISRQPIQREPVDVAELGSQAFQELRELNPEQNATFQISAEKLTVHADRGLTKVLLTNLISNALKFSTNQKESIVELGQKKIDGDNYFYIKDNGVGFDPAHSEKLFKAFSRLHSQREFKGTGIGLAIVQRIVNLHGGKVFAKGKPGEGAIFYFNLHEPV